MFSQAPPAIYTKRSRMFAVKRVHSTEPTKLMKSCEVAQKLIYETPNIIHMKLAVCLGGTYDMYFKYAKILESLQEEFSQKNKSTFTNGKSEIKIFFAFGPEESEVLDYARHFVEKEGESYPPCAKETSEQIKKYRPDYVLFFGIAGGLNAPLNKICYPVQFCEYYFKSPYLIYKQKAKSRCIYIKNLLGKSELRVLTSNFVLNKWAIGAGDNMKLWSDVWQEVESDLRKRHSNLKGKEAAKKWCEIKFRKEFLPILRSKGDLMDMESYIFAREFSDKIGIMLQVSDVPKKELTFKREHINWNKFRKNVIECIWRVTGGRSN